MMMVCQNTVARETTRDRASWRTRIIANDQGIPMSAKTTTFASRVLQEIRAMVTATLIRERHLLETGKTVVSGDLIGVRHLLITIGLGVVEGVPLMVATTGMTSDSTIIMTIGMEIGMMEDINIVVMGGLTSPSTTITCSPRAKSYQPQNTQNTYNTYSTYSTYNTYNTQNMQNTWTYTRTFTNMSISIAEAMHILKREVEK